MGNRANVIFVDEQTKTISPAVYLHWNGGPESVYQFLDELDRREVSGNGAHYEAARFCQVVGEFFDQDAFSGTSLGIENGPRAINTNALLPYDMGDNGVYVVYRQAKSRKVRRFVCEYVGDRRTLRELGQTEVAYEYAQARKSGYYEDGGFRKVWQTLHGDKLPEGQRHAKQAKNDHATALLQDAAAQRDAVGLGE